MLDEPVVSRGREFRLRALAARCLLMTAIILLSHPSLLAADAVKVNEHTESLVENQRAFNFYATIHSNRDVNKLNYGFDAVFPIVYAGSLWPRGADLNEPDQTYITESLQKRYGSDPPERLVIDIEHWPVSIMVSPSIRAESIVKYIAVLEAAHHALPETKLGLYSVLPIREYWAPLTGTPDQISAWNAANRQLAILADHVDFVAPSLYTFYRSRSGWKRYAIANIEAARIYGKPVYPFLWPRYHVSNNFYPETLIEQDFFDLQLKLVYELADGVIVWNGPYDRWKLPMLWFKRTANTIERLRQARKPRSQRQKLVVSENGQTRTRHWR